MILAMTIEVKKYETLTTINEGLCQSNQKFKIFLYYTSQRSIDTTK